MTINFANLKADAARIALAFVDGATATFSVSMLLNIHDVRGVQAIVSALIGGGATSAVRALRSMLALAPATDAQVAADSLATPDA